VDEAIAAGLVMRREAMWSESLAVGSKAFVETVREKLRHRAGRRAIWASEDGEASHHLREEPLVPYTPQAPLLDALARTAQSLQGRR
jgi:hypothetical protein